MGIVTCCGENLCVPNSRPTAEVLLSRGWLVRWVSEESDDSKQAIGVFQGAAEPAVILLLKLLDRPADMNALCAVPTYLTLHVPFFHTLHISPQVQLGTLNRTDHNGHEVI